VRGRVVAAAVVSTVVLTGCQSIPEDATTKDFCSAGEKYSELRDVAFSEAVRVSKQLAEVGTPADIDASARAGFVELIERMDDADNGADFRRRTLSMNEQERKHLLDLDTYIQKTCAQPAS
jgi:hypothetical protein